MLNLNDELKFYRSHLYDDVLRFWEKYSPTLRQAEYLPAFQTVGISFFLKTNIFGARAACCGFSRGY